VPADAGTHARPEYVVEEPIDIDTGRADPPRHGDVVAPDPQVGAAGARRASADLPCHQPVSSSSYTKTIDLADGDVPASHISLVVAWPRLFAKSRAACATWLRPIPRPATLLRVTILPPVVLHEFAGHPAEPSVLLRRWLADAEAAGEDDPFTAVLATADALGQPSTRCVAVRSVEERGLVMFANLNTRKGRDLHANPRAAITFYWPSLLRQVNITGHVTGRAATRSTGMARWRGSCPRWTGWRCGRSAGINQVYQFSERQCVRQGWPRSRRARHPARRTYPP
jgi:pyridoxine/pyridoxamine 5'-phosphate oxidase